MLSRISSFSGPLSPAFKMPGGFTLNGLILRYIIKDISSYGGTGSVIDKVSNSNATLYNGQNVVGIGPTYSSNGYLNFDGVNDYILTNTSLNSKLSPANTSTIISHFIWIYPQDNGVIITEQGNTYLNSGWHDSQIEIVSGVLKFRVWETVIVTSSISISLNNWYYVGLTYDGSVLRGYVNGQFAGSASGSRLTPWNNGSNTGLHYAIGAADSTSLGDATYAKMKMGDFHVYNKALTSTQILNNYNLTKNEYIYTDSMKLWVDANDPQSYSGSGLTFTDMSGSGNNGTITNATFSMVSGVKTFGFDGSGDYISIGQPIQSGSNYTICAWVNANTTVGSRNIVSSADTPLFISSGTLYAGVGNNYTLVSSTSFPTGVWKFVSVSFNDNTNTMKLYIDGVLKSTNSSVTQTYSAQNTFIGSHFSGGVNSSFFDGYISSVNIYSKELTIEQINQNFNSVKHVYSNSVTNNLRLYFNPSSILTYSGSDNISDLSGNSLNGTLSNVTFINPYFNFNGINSQISINDSTSLEPGSSSWTMEVWFSVNSFSSSSVILGKFDNGGTSQNVSYSIRVNTSGNLFAQYSNGSPSTFINSTSYSLSAGKLYQAVYVWTNSGLTKTLETFINGVSIGSVNHSFSSILNSTNPLYLGSYNNGEYSQWLNGKIGIVRIYNSALSASDILQNFEASRSIYKI